MAPDNSIRAAIAHAIRQQPELAIVFGVLGIIVIMAAVCASV